MPRQTPNETLKLASAVDRARRAHQDTLVATAGTLQKAGYSVAAIGRELGVTRQRAHQLVREYEARREAS